MLVNLREKLSRFRSELHMSRYEKAIKEGQNLITMLKQIEQCGLNTEVRSLISNIEQEIQLATAIQKMITEGTNKQSTVKQEPKVNKVENKINSETQIPSKWGKNTQAEKVGKWGKKSQFKNSPQKQMAASQPLSFSGVTLNYSIESISGPVKQKKQEEQINQIVLGTDEHEIVEREIILPLNIPEFFKNKQPHRLIVCYYEKCKDLLKVLKQEISHKKQIIELEELNQWTASGKQDCLRIYVAPFYNGQEKLISQILQYDSNFLILYSENNRQLLTEKPSILKNEGYRLKF